MTLSKSGHDRPATVPTMLLDRFCPTAFATVFATVAIAFSTPAFADTPMFLIEPGEIKIDGVIDDWDGATFFPLGVRVEGNPTSVVRAALGYDNTHLFVAAQVTDPTFVRTNRFSSQEDHLELLLSFPEDGDRYGRVHEVKLFAGKPGEIEGRVVAVGAGQVRGAEIVEAPAKGGYTVEAKIPWSLFAPAAHTRVKMRGALRYLKGDGRTTTGIAASSISTRAVDMPMLSTAPEQSLERGLLRERNLVNPSIDLVANVAGDAMKERVLVYDRYLVVYGPGFRNGAEYFWSDLEVDPAAGELPMFEVRDVTGDGRDEIIVRRRVARGHGWRELLQVFSFRGDVLESIFEHETGIQSPVGAIENAVTLVPSGKVVNIVVALGTHAGYHALNYREPVDTDRQPLLLPWGTVRSRTFGWNGKRFVQRSQETKEADAPPPQPVQPVERVETVQVSGPPPPRPPSSDELLDQVYALYKRDHGVSAFVSPTFDFVTNVAGSSELERVVCHGRDLVVFGKDFREGRAYVSLQMQQFASERDIHDVTAFDVTGDGLADLVVRGSQRRQAPEELGRGELVREVLFIYRVDESAIVRVFAAETAMVLGNRRVHSLLGWVPVGRGFEIEVRPGRAVGWTQATWPYRQDVEAVGGLEPLVLPWTEGMVRYRFVGSVFGR